MAERLGSWLQRMTSPDTPSPATPGLPFCASGKKACDHPDWCAEQDQCWHDAQAADELMDCYQYGKVPATPGDAEIVEAGAKALCTARDDDPETWRHYLGESRVVIAAIRPIIEAKARQSERECRASPLLIRVRALFRQQSNWTVAALAAAAAPPSTKRLYNALGYLSRRQEIRQTAYGHYEATHSPLSVGAKMTSKKTDAELERPDMPSEERLARMIARAEGHNDSEGKHWERYVEAARLILRECIIRFKN